MLWADIQLIHRRLDRVHLVAIIVDDEPRIDSDVLTVLSEHASAEPNVPSMTQRARSPTSASTRSRISRGLVGDDGQDIHGERGPG